MKFQEIGQKIDLLVCKTFGHDKQPIYMMDSTGKKSKNWQCRRCGIFPVPADMKMNEWKDLKNEEVGELFLFPDGDEIMQFTGLKDKQGKEIYEGDIIKINKRREGFESVYGYEVVKWERGEETYDANGMVGYDTYPAEDGEVIGNIYENPDLIKDK